MQIRRVNGNTYDIFGHIGFDHWTRVRRFHWGIKPIAGKPLTRDKVRSIILALADHPNGSIDNLVIGPETRSPDEEQVD
jgi:hypothetical protein